MSPALHMVNKTSAYILLKTDNVQLLTTKLGVFFIYLRPRRRHRNLLDDVKERRGYSHLKEETGSHYVESSLWKRLWTYRTTDY
jgi:hypothetical protein